MLQPSNQHWTKKWIYVKFSLSKCDAKKCEGGQIREQRWFMPHLHHFNRSGSNLKWYYDQIFTP